MSQKDDNISTSALIAEITINVEYHNEQMLKYKEVSDFAKALYHQTYMSALSDVLIILKKK